MSDNRPPSQSGPPEGQPPGWSVPPGQAPPPGWGPPPGQAPPPGQGPPPDWGPPPGQGPPPGWGPPPGQGPPPGWGPPPGQGPPPGWGPPPGGPEQPGGRRKLAVIIGVAVVAVIVVIAAVVGITQYGGGDDTDASSSSDGASSANPSDDPSDDPSDETPDVMTASGADALRKQLTAKGWRCYDSLDMPTPVKQCYLWKKDGKGHTKGELSLQYTDEESVGSIAFHVQSPSAVQGKIVRNVTGLIGDTLIGGNGEKVQKVRKTSASGDEVEGVFITGSEGGLNATVSSAEVPTLEPVPMPPVRKTRSAMEKKGLHCKVDDGALVCDGAKNGVRLRAIGTLENGHISGGWTMSLSPDDLKGGKASKAAELAANVLRSVGLTDAAGAKFLRTHYQTDQQGDFAHYHVSVINSSSGNYYSLMISVQEIS